MSLDYLNVCRLCASSCEHSVPIFEETGLMNIAEKIRSYLHVEIKNSNDADNPRMCNACYQKIINWDQYVEQVQKVQGMFLSMTEETKPGEEFSMEVVNEKVTDCDSSLGFMSGCEENKDGGSPVGKKKEKKLKKVKTNQENNLSEDEIPLSNHVSTIESTGPPNGLKEKETKKMKPRIKLKIKPIKRSTSEEDSPKVVNETEMKDEDDENCLDDDDDEIDLKDENKVKMAGVQSLFTWECLVCHINVKNWNALVKHCKEIHNTNASVQCMCGKFLQSRASIMKHRTKHTIGYGYKCEFENCNKTFHRQQLLDAHSVSHMPKELQPWMCSKCSKRFHTESLLKQHKKVHLPKEEKLIYPCEVCLKKFCSKSAVTAHIRAVHFRERPFVCHQCGHSFTSKGILHEHLTIHSDVYNFHCKDCNKSFKTKYRLKIHMDTHVETRYQCPICTLTLNTRRTLRMHLLVHKDVKAFQCTTCGKAFKRSKDLKNHYNLHTGRRPYTCPFCQRTFANGSNCRSHKLRMHPEELKLYEAALAAGQQPVLLTAENQQEGENRTNSQLDESNEAKIELQYSERNEKHVMPGHEISNKGDEKAVCHFSMPLNLQRDEKGIKEEDVEGRDEGLVESVGLNENISGNITQLTFGTQSQTVQYPVHNFYSFQSSGIPAFPGNPFFRQ